MTVNTAKKGITAVVAIVLLLMMTVAAAGLAYMWISQMQAGTQAKTSAQVETQQEQMLGAISIESIWYDATDTKISVRNVGSSTFPDASVFKVYIDGADTALGVAFPATALAPSGTATATITSGANSLPAAGAKMNVRVVTANGVETTKTCKIPTTGATYC